jgi:adenosylhomocysteine nucleosidase
MTKKLIYFAHPLEAQATIMQTRAVALQDDKKAYQFGHGLILVGGMGILATMHVLGRYIHQVDEVWNLGIVGALQPHYQLGDCVQISQVQRSVLFPQDLAEYSQQFHNTLFPAIALTVNNENKGARLVTCDYPIHQQHLAHQLARHADVVDMEGYGVAYIAQQWQRPCRMWKVISDFASAGGPELIKAQLRSASLQLATIVQELN